MKAKHKEIYVVKDPIEPSKKQDNDDDDNDNDSKNVEDRDLFMAVVKEESGLIEKDAEEQVKISLIQTQSEMI